MQEVWHDLSTHVPFGINEILAQIHVDDILSVRQRGDQTVDAGDAGPHGIIRGSSPREDAEEQDLGLWLFGMDRFNDFSDTRRNPLRLFIRKPQVVGADHDHESLGLITV